MAAPKLPQRVKMSSFEHLDALRRQNRELLAKLRRTKEQKQTQKAIDPSEETENEAPDSGRVSIVTERFKHCSTVTEKNEGASNGTKTVVGVLRPNEGRKASRKAKIKSTNTAEPEDSLLQDRGNSHPRGQLVASRQLQPEQQPGVFSQNKDRMGLNQVQTPDPELDRVSESERRRVQPLLGYDWIAGLLDAETSLTERSEQFFGELRTFRQDNKEECVHSPSSGLQVEADSWTSPLEDDVAEEEPTPDAHQCTFCYRINHRLFAVPLDSHAACPVCKKAKAKHPHTETEPALIRVCLPRSALLPVYRYKAHRRSSFDSSDSLGLSSHCLAGWSNIKNKAGSQMTYLDLRSSLSDTEAALAAGFKSQLYSTAPGVSGSQHYDPPADLSRLGQYHFQHHSTVRKSKRGSFLVS